MPKNSKLGPIKFPIDTHQQLGSKISFQAIEVKPPEIDIKLEKSETHKDISSSSGGGGPLPGVPPGVEDPGLQGTFGNIGDKIGNFFKGAGQGSMGAGQKINLLRGEKIDLYLPVAYQVNDALQYDHAQLGTIGAGVAGALHSGGGVVQGTMESINEGFSSIGDFFKSGAKAYVASRDKKDKPFKAAEFPKTRSVSQLTSPRRLTPTPTNQRVGYANPDVQNAMRMLSNSSNRDIIRLMPVDVVSPIRKQNRNIALGPSTLGKIQ